MYLVTFQLWAAVWSLQLISVGCFPSRGSAGVVTGADVGTRPPEEASAETFITLECLDANISILWLWPRSLSQSVPVCPDRRVNNRRTVFRLKLNFVLLHRWQLPPLKPHLTNIKGNENVAMIYSRTCWWKDRWSFLFYKTFLDLLSKTGLQQKTCFKNVSTSPEILNYFKKTLFTSLLCCWTCAPASDNVHASLKKGYNYL